MKKVGIKQATKQGYIEMKIGGWQTLIIQQVKKGVAEYRMTEI